MDLYRIDTISPGQHRAFGGKTLNDQTKYVTHALSTTERRTCRSISLRGYISVRKRNYFSVNYISEAVTEKKDLFRPEFLTWDRGNARLVFKLSTIYWTTDCMIVTLCRRCNWVKLLINALLSTYKSVVNPIKLARNDKSNFLTALLYNNHETASISTTLCRYPSQSSRHNSVNRISLARYFS